MFLSHTYVFPDGKHTAQKTNADSKSQRYRKQHLKQILCRNKHHHGSHQIELFCNTSGYRVNARSVLGCVAALEFEDLWIESENDIYDKIEKYIVIGDNDGNYIHN